MERADMAEHIPCRACEGTGDHWRHDPQPDDPELRTRIYGKPCEDCGGSGVLEDDVS
jgi:hypothetical protein